MNNINKQPQVNDMITVSLGSNGNGKLHTGRLITCTITHVFLNNSVKVASDDLWLAVFVGGKWVSVA